ncbi:phage tail sheath family protein [Subsaximicrobium wynnwilliamsii]|uniref:Phage tail sheath family protein n=2 Tax=Subsaximicrobium wynnwilliamsii TaxID=291179 RepID=A0A5C6ZPH7_9FLAO|nr:phage tail sheath family protein [Subsaximicrobium wynnwilliamsii]TXD91327.1 phage tail sheath family protein [Subsaximicrobium wynnwilliamsii]TXE04720.1 phage tail sheath family protein [Subsaximicrobium wynnwilliamsii]
MLEFEVLFGGVSPPASMNIDLATNIYDVTESQFKLYNSLRLFYANGGGDCYIVSIGSFDSAPDFSASTPFEDGLALLESFDEPTLILFPDAINLTAENLGLVQKAALTHCSELMDRFTIMDVRIASDLGTDLAAFRDQVGNRDLKYGAAYYPYLQSSFGHQFRYRDIVNGGVDFRAAHSSNSEITTAIDKFDEYQSDLDTLATACHDAKLANAKIDITSESNVNDYNASLWNLLRPLGDVSGSGLLETEVENAITGSLQSLAQRIFDFATAFNGLDDNTDITLVTGASDFIAPWEVSSTGPVSTPNPYDNQLNQNSDSDAADFSKVKNLLDKLHNQIVQSLNSLVANLRDLELQEENNLVSMLSEYSGIITRLNGTMNTVPPSGAMAGIYAYVDANRGVWKAPANVSLNGIIGLTDDVNYKEQATMNVHETGKSINAIRKFTGKGLLVWGARTLDGNSNDWRYINVRRLANMIEESCKKAAFNFVFEPNVKQTWVAVNGMISNFLSVVWRDGGLSGAKPEDAFFVSVGLGQTMTAQDILEGRMIVKIGYAPSRPAEFIVLEFTQMQQRS